MCNHSIHIFYQDDIKNHSLRWDTGSCWTKIFALFSKIFLFSAAVSTRVTGKMVRDTVLAWRVEESGCIEESGPRASREDMEWDSQHQHQPSTREPGPMVCKMDTAPKHTPMEVKYFPSNILIWKIFCVCSLTCFSLCMLLKINEWKLSFLFSDIYISIHFLFFSYIFKEKVKNSHNS